jgi:hypothetical protein
MKPCVRCGSEMEARKKKCSSCGELQTPINNTMAKNNSSSFPVGAVLIGLIFGAVIMFFLYPSLVSQEPIQAPLSINDARALEVDGVLVFIKSEPKVKNLVLGSLTQDKVLALINKIDGIAHDNDKNFLEKMAGTFGEVWQNVNFHERIKKFIKAAKNDYPEVEGLVFNGSNLKEATVIKFN